jgi:hypothetical protein
MIAADIPAISAALLTLRPRAKASRRKETADAAGLALTWLALDDGAELLGVDFSALDPRCLDVPALVSLLPGELIPETVTTDPVRRVTAIRFRTQRGHFRCRDCDWGDATDARGTHPSCRSSCASERTAGVRKAHLKEEGATR